MDLVAMASSVPHLQELHISPASWLVELDDGFLTDEKIESIASNTRQLRQIDLYGICFVTDNW